MIQTAEGEILFIVAHPYLWKSRANSAILRAVRGIPGLHTHLLYEKYPYFHIDVAQEKDLLLKHDLIVVQHPFYWYSMPALLKLWLDEVFESGWAYGPGGDKLKGKKLLVSTTAGGPEDSYTPASYNRFPMETFLAPWNQTASLCQMEWLDPCVLHGSIRASSEDLEAHAQHVRGRLLGYSERGGTA